MPSRPKWDLIPSFGYQLWDTSWILSDSSYPGRALHTLIGYVDQPTAMQLIVYAVTLAVSRGFLDPDE